MNENSDILNNIESTNFGILILDQRIGKKGKVNEICILSDNSKCS